ncbi:MAG TPA: hypothetical protein VGL61_29485 [Kofleriaceae bacterium]|jgi:S1-C subfamily serine protease
MTERSTGKLVAIVLAAVAVVLAGIAVIVVATRRAPVAATIDTRAVAAADLVTLGSDSQVRFDLQGAHVDDVALAGRLGLLPGDVVVELSGVPILQARDIERVITLNGREIYVELVRDHTTTIARWKMVGELRDARQAARDSARPSLPLPPPSTIAPPAQDPLLETIVRDDDTHVHLPRATVEAVVADPMKYISTVRVVPAMANGMPSGFKLYAIRPGSLPARLGLENGDRLDAVNGMRIDSSAAALEAYTKLRHAVRLDVSLTRRNQPVEITILIN